MSEVIDQGIAILRVLSRFSADAAPVGTIHALAAALQAEWTTPRFQTTLVFDITSRDLALALEARAEHHREKAESYAAQAKGLKDKQVDADMGYQTQNPVQQLEQQGQTHRNRESFFRFMAAHLSPDCAFRLDEKELVRLELIDRFF